MAGGGAMRAERRRESERERDGAHRVEEGMASALELSTGGGEGHDVGRACMPSMRRRWPNAVGRAWRGHVRAGGGRGRGRGEAGSALLAGPVGWRRPASEQPPSPFF